MWVNSTVAISALAACGSVLALALTGCGGAECQDYPCETVDVARLEPLAGSTVTWNGKDFVPIRAAGRMRPPEGMCVASVEPLHFEATGAHEVGLDQSVLVQCVQNGRHLVFGTDLDEIRDTYTDEREEKVHGWSALDDQAADCGLGGAASITVSHGVGSGAPFPQLVTPDFAREIVVQVHIGGPLSCEQVDATLRFHTTSADYVGRTHQTCTISSASSPWQATWRYENNALS